MSIKTTFLKVNIINIPNDKTIDVFALDFPNLGDASTKHKITVGNVIYIDKEDFKKIINGEKTKMEYVEGRMIALRKIFCGDDGDNIPAFYTWINDKGKEEAN